MKAKKKVSALPEKTKDNLLGVDSPHLSISFQGVKGAYSEQAALKYFSQRKISFDPQPEFDQVFSAVEHGNVDFGMLPLENSLTGSIHQNYDLLLSHHVWICGEIKIRISHNLLCKPGCPLKKISEVFSHPQALLQCKGLFKEHAHLSAVAFFDTAGSANHVAQSSDPTIAAIASLNAATEYNLHPLKRAIEDNEENYTKFIVISKDKILSSPHVASDQFKTSLLLSLKNIPGALHKALSIFAIRDIDLLKIESRPIPGKPWQYLFYLDFGGKIESEACQNAVEHLKEISQFVKVLGSYPICPQ